MSVAWQDVASSIAGHPLIGAGLTLLFVLILGLGVMDVIRIFATLMVEVVREFKHQLIGIVKVLRRLKRELTTWRVDLGAPSDSRRRRSRFVRFAARVRFLHRE